LLNIKVARSSKGGNQTSVRSAKLINTDNKGAQHKNVTDISVATLHSPLILLAVEKSWVIIFRVEVLTTDCFICNSCILQWDFAFSPYRQETVTTDSNSLCR